MAQMVRRDRSVNRVTRAHVDNVVHQVNQERQVFVEMQVKMAAREHPDLADESDNQEGMVTMDQRAREGQQVRRVQVAPKVKWERLELKVTEDDPVSSVHQVSKVQKVTQDHKDPLV